MIPEPGNIIVVFFRNGVQLEGEVISWSDDKSVLKSLTGTSVIVIQKTLDDIMFYKFSAAKTEYEKLKSKPIKDENDIKEIAQLKVELNDLERSEIREKLNTHTAGGLKQVSYGIPNNIKIDSIKQYTGKEAPRQDSSFDKELQNLFNKRH